jgi:hypothetical protein
VIELDLSTNGKDYPNILRPHATVVVYGMSSNESTLPTLWLMRNSITLRLFLVCDLSAADRDVCLAELPAIGRDCRASLALEPGAPAYFKSGNCMWFSCFTTTSVCAFSNGQAIVGVGNAAARQRDDVLKLGELNHHANPVRRMLSARNRSRARWS